MSGKLSKVLSEDEIERIRAKAIELGSADKADKAWAAMRPLLRAQNRQREAAIALIKIVDSNCLSTDQVLEALSAIHESHVGDQRLLGYMGDSLRYARDINQLNLAAPEHPLFARVVEDLLNALKAPQDAEVEAVLLSGLACAARMMSRQRDEIAESSAKRLVELDPNDSSNHYVYGLWCKTRGRFREGMQANQIAASLVEKPIDSYEWNLGICATGAGEATVALNVWKRMDQKIEIGRFGLPDGSYGQCKVRLAQRPLAERNADADDPGLEETIWLERLSPCHGIIRSVLFQPELGVDYGDVVLIDGAPITYHKYGEREVPVFPHLATLVRQQYQFFAFAGTQDAPDRISDITDELEGDVIVYSHTENFEFLCASCWRDPNNNHEKHEKEQKHIVRGRIAAPPDYSPAELLAQIDKALSNREPCKIYTPDLCEAAGLSERAAFERRRFEMLSG